MPNRDQAWQAIENAALLPREGAVVAQYIQSLELHLKYLIDSVVGTGTHDLAGYGYTEAQVKALDDLVNQIPYPHGWEP